MPFFWKHVQARRKTKKRQRTKLQRTKREKNKKIPELLTLPSGEFRKQKWRPSPSIIMGQIRNLQHANGPRSKMQGVLLLTLNPDLLQDALGLVHFSCKATWLHNIFPPSPENNRRHPDLGIFRNRSYSPSSAGYFMTHAHASSLLLAFTSAFVFSELQ